MLAHAAAPSLGVCLTMFHCWGLCSMKITIQVIFQSNFYSLTSLSLLPFPDQSYNWASALTTFYKITFLFWNSLRLARSSNSKIELLYIFLSTWYFQYFYFSHPNRYVMVSPCCFHYISLMTKDIEDLFMCLLAIHILSDKISI